MLLLVSAVNTLSFSTSTSPTISGSRHSSFSPPHCSITLPTSFSFFQYLPVVQCLSPSGRKALSFFSVSCLVSKRFSQLYDTTTYLFCAVLSPHACAIVSISSIIPIYVLTFMRTFCFFFICKVTHLYKLLYYTAVRVYTYTTEVGIAMSEESKRSSIPP